MLAGVERRAVGQSFGKGIHGLIRVVAIDAGFGRDRTQHPVAMIIRAIALRRANLPAVDLLAKLGHRFVHRLVAGLHAQTDLEFVFQRKRVKAEFLASTNTNAGEFGADFLFFRSGRRELQREIEILEEIRLHRVLRDRREINRRRGGRRGLMQIGRERLRLVTGLNFHHVRHVVGIKELGAKNGQPELRRGMENFLDTRRGLPFPIGTDHQIVARVVAGRAAADVTVVEHIAITQHHRVVAVFLDRGHGDHDRLGAQIQPQHGIGRVTIRRDDGGVFVGEDAGFVRNLIERTFVLARVFIHAEFIHHRVIHHERQAINKTLLRDVSGFQNAGCILLGFLGLRNSIVFGGAAGEQHSGEGSGNDILYAWNKHNDVLLIYLVPTRSAMIIAGSNSSNHFP